MEGRTRRHSEGQLHGHVAGPDPGSDILRLARRSDTTPDLQRPIYDSVRTPWSTSIPETVYPGHLDMRDSQEGVLDSVHCRQVSFHIRPMTFVHPLIVF